MSLKFKIVRARGLLALACFGGLAAPATWAVPVSLAGSSSVVINYQLLTGDVIAAVVTNQPPSALTAQLTVYDQLGATGTVLGQFSAASWAPTTVWFNDGAFSLQIATGPGPGTYNFDFYWQVVRQGNLVTIPGALVNPTATVPEPSGLALAGAALALAAAARHRRASA